MNNHTPYLLLRVIEGDPYTKIVEQIEQLRIRDFGALHRPGTWKSYCDSVEELEGQVIPSHPYHERAFLGRLFRTHFQKAYNRLTTNKG